MNIKYASNITGVSKDMIRFYEKKGILKPGRNTNNYRDYTDEDLNTIVLAKQYSMMGIHLDTIASMIQNRNISQASHELSVTIEQLQEDILWSQVRLSTAREYQELFHMMETNTPYQIGRHIPQYYYPINPDAKESMYPSFNRFGSVTKSVFRIRQQDTASSHYQQDIGLLTPKMHPDTSLSHDLYPEHLYFRTIIQAPHNSLLSYQQIQPILNQIQQLHYKQSGDLFLYEIMKNSTDKGNDTYVVVEVMIEKA